MTDYNDFRLFPGLRRVLTNDKQYLREEEFFSFLWIRAILDFQL